MNTQPSPVRDFLSRTKTPLILCGVAVLALLAWLIVHNITSPGAVAPAGTPSAATSATVRNPGGNLAPPTPSDVGKSPTPSDNPTGEGPPPGADTTARAWADALVNTSGGKAAWLKRLQPLVADTIWQGYHDTDLRMLPKGPVRDVTTYEPSSGQTAASISFSDGAKYAILLQYDGFGPDGWQVIRTDDH